MEKDPSETSSETSIEIEKEKEIEYIEISDDQDEDNAADRIMNGNIFICDVVLTENLVPKQWEEKNIK